MQPSDCLTIFELWLVVIVIGTWLLVGVGVRHIFKADEPQQQQQQPRFRAPVTPQRYLLEQG